MNRRPFLRYFSVVGLSLTLLLHFVSRELVAASPAEALNVLLITADDLNYDSVGAYGCPIPQITPHIDKLAKGGMRFDHAHVNIAVCQPSRQSIMTSRYPHSNGAEGFDPINEDVPTLQESLRKAGYVNGIMGKEKHMKPVHKFCWDYNITEGQLSSGAGIGRSPEKYFEFSKDFIQLAKERNKPFFLMANIHDPHRPFAGSEQERRSWGANLPKISRHISEDVVSVPEFLADLPDVKKEITEYYTSVYRCDQSVGAILKALKESGLEKNTLVMFISDNGMAVPFAKANCYLNSTKTPWIVNWPGQIKAGSVDSEHLISGIDYMPTILDALGIKAVEGMDGSSFLPLLRGQEQPNRDYVFTEFHKTFARAVFPMRGIHNKRFGYIINFWAGKTAPMRMDSTSGLTFNAMKKAGESNPEIAARVALFEHRVLEEFFDFQSDPAGLHNLIADPLYEKQIATMRHELEQHLKVTNDPALSAFINRNDSPALDAFMKAQKIRAKNRKQKK
ncbi:sulfatase [Verrucomicrobia bacterium]|nr:sulfatase [Verrucomicrobiota bacterium]